MEKHEGLGGRIERKLHHFTTFFPRDQILSCSPETHYVDQAVMELIPPASASQVLELKACAITPGSFYIFYFSSLQPLSVICLKTILHGVLLEVVRNKVLFWVLSDRK